jgi:hypothetical protein
LCAVRREKRYIALWLRYGSIHTVNRPVNVYIVKKFTTNVLPYKVYERSYHILLCKKQELNTLLLHNNRISH